MEETKPEKARSVKSKEYLRYDFTEAEFLEHARLLSRLNQELERAEDRKKRVSAEVSADVKACQDKVSNESRLVANAYEYRDVETEIRFHDPKAGQKTIVRTDTGEVLRTVLMSGQDLQDAFGFEADANEASEAEA